MNQTYDSNELEKIIESTFYGLFVANSQGVIIFVNRAFERITGFLREEVVGRKMGDLLASGQYKDSVTLRVIKSLKSETIVQKLPNGKSIIVTGNPLFDNNGKLWRVVVNVRDVAEVASLQQYVNRSEVEESLTSESGGVVVCSKAMREIEDLARRMGHVDSTVLILGESGTGKEVCADLVWFFSKRVKEPFVKISCSAIAENLLESELFGYIGGAFTGANAKGKQGFFEKANNGTIFLDEVGELPLHLQSKLLRILQERAVVPVGGTTPIPIDVRIICATNRDLRKMVAEGSFRKDLYYRLNVVSIVVPPLRERKVAISNLAYKFLNLFNIQYGFHKQLDNRVLDVFMRYDWPGNIREIKNTLERLVVMNCNDIIFPEDLPEEFQHLVAVSENMHNASLATVLENTEKSFIHMCLKSCRTTRELAKRLGISQSSAVRKLRQYGLRFEQDQE